MSDSSRRRFLTAAAGAAGGVALSAIAVPAVTGGHGHTTEASSLPKASPQSVTAYIGDVHTGKVSLMVEGHEVVVTDRTLTEQIARAFVDAGRL